MQIRMLGSWAEPMERYLQTEELPEDKNEARKIKFRAARYALIGEDLYKRGYSQPYLKCVTMEESDYILKEIHFGAMEDPLLPLHAGFEDGILLFLHLDGKLVFQN